MDAMMVMTGGGGGVPKEAGARAGSDSLQHHLASAGARENLAYDDTSGNRLWQVSTVQDNGILDRHVARKASLLPFTLYKQFLSAWLLIRICFNFVTVYYRITDGPKFIMRYGYTPLETRFMDIPAICELCVLVCLLLSCLIPLIGDCCDSCRRRRRIAARKRERQLDVSGPGETASLVAANGGGDDYDSDDDDSFGGACMDGTNEMFNLARSRENFKALGSWSLMTFAISQATPAAYDTIFHRLKNCLGPNRCCRIGAMIFISAFVMVTAALLITLRLLYFDLSHGKPITLWNFVMLLSFWNNIAGSWDTYDITVYSGLSWMFGGGASGISMGNELDVNAASDPKLHDDHTLCCYGKKKANKSKVANASYLSASDKHDSSNEAIPLSGVGVQGDVALQNMESGSGVGMAAEINGDNEATKEPLLGRQSSSSDQGDEESDFTQGQILSNVYSLAGPRKFVSKIGSAMMDERGRLMGFLLFAQLTGDDIRLLTVNELDVEAGSSVIVLPKSFSNPDKVALGQRAEQRRAHNAHRNLVGAKDGSIHLTGEARRKTLFKQAAKAQVLSARMMAASGGRAGKASRTASAASSSSKQVVESRHVVDRHDSGL